MLAQPSQHVRPGDVLLELSNPDVQIQALQAEEQLTAARAQLVSLRTTLETQRLAQAGTLATMRTAYAKAQRDVSEADSLAAIHLLSDFEVASRRDIAKEDSTRLDIEQQRLVLMTETVDSQLAVQQSQAGRQRLGAPSRISSKTWCDPSRSVLPRLRGRVRSDASAGPVRHGGDATREGWFSPPS